jgi:hypothetical protein
MLFQILQFLFGRVLLFDVPQNLSDIFFEHIIISKYILGYIPRYSNNFSFNYFVNYKIVNISLDPIESYTTEIANNIYYFG